MAGILTKVSRAQLRNDQFAFRDTRQLPLHDADHVKMAWSQIGSVKAKTAEQRREARSLTLTAAKALSVDTANWELSIAAAAQKWGQMDISAMALNISNDDDHPNKMPFSGILTYIGRPSDSAPHGSAGRLVCISAEAAKAAIPSLLGMAVNYRPKFDGHDAQEKIGLITEATIDGDKIRIAGFIYAADFPEAAATIQAMKDDLGFSFEAKKIVVKDIDADLLEIESMAFTGASILLKDKAAYLNTSLAASAEEENEMTPEQAKMLEDLAKALPAITASVDDLKKKVNETHELSVSAANMLSKVEPLAKSLETQAAALEAAGIGGHPTRGHATVLRNMASTMRASAAMGTLPSSFDGMYFSAETPAGGADVAKQIKDAVDAAVKPLHDKLASSETEIKDLKAANARSVPGTSQAPARKSVDATLQAAADKTLKKINLNAGDTPLAVGVVDAALKASGIFGQQATAAKIELSRAGLME